MKQPSLMKGGGKKSVRKMREERMNKYESKGIPLRAPVARKQDDRLGEERHSDPDCRELSEKEKETAGVTQAFVHKSGPRQTT